MILSIISRSAERRSYLASLRSCPASVRSPRRRWKYAHCGALMNLISSTTDAAIVPVVTFTASSLPPHHATTTLTFGADCFVRQPLGDRLLWTANLSLEWSDLIVLVSSNVDDVVRECVDCLGRRRKKHRLSKSGLERRRNNLLDVAKRRYDAASRRMIENRISVLQPTI